MNRWDAEKAIRGSDDLNAGEALLLLVLLARADNESCVVPRRFAPSLPILAAEAKCHRVTVQRRLTHLESHGWLERERSTGGAGVKTIYRLLPTGAPRTCTCRKQVHRVHENRCISSGAEQVHSNGDNRCTATDGKYRGVVVGRLENEAADGVPDEDENGHFVAAPRTNFRSYDEAECTDASCDRPPRHGLLTCLEHAHDEFMHRRARRQAAS